MKREYAQYGQHHFLSGPAMQPMWCKVGVPIDPQGYLPGFWGPSEAQTNRWGFTCPHQYPRNYDAEGRPLMSLWGPCRGAAMPWDSLRHFHFWKTRTIEERWIEDWLAYFDVVDWPTKIDRARNISASRPAGNGRRA